MHKILKLYASFFSKGFIYGKLYKIDWYPGVKLSRKDKTKVFGEVYLLKNSKKVLNILDEYEECSNKFKKPYEYRRVKTDIYTKKGKIKAWIYEYNRRVFEKDRIKSGQFKRSF